MNKLKKYIVTAVAGLFVAVAGFVTVAISVTLVPLISLLIGLWIGFVTEWLTDDLLLVDNLPALMATIFFLVSAVTMLVKVNVKENKK